MVRLNVLENVQEQKLHYFAGKKNLNMENNSLNIVNECV